MLSTNFLNKNLPTCIYNASGPRCTSFEELASLAECPYTAATLTKSTTLEAREGNPHPRYWDESPILTTNSTGLANLGYQQYGLFASTIKEINPTKPYIISVSGLSMVDNLHMINYYNQSEIKIVDGSTVIDAIELNLSCPNVVGKPQIGYDLQATEELLDKIFDLDTHLSKPIPIGLKMPPYFDQSHITEMGDLLNNYPNIDYITCINSLGNGLVIDTNRESPVIRPKRGLGGIGGIAVLPFALSNVFQFRQTLANRIQIVGCGGITTGEDAFQHLLVGASMIQIGSQYMREGVDCFPRISNELINIMKYKKYHHVHEFRGQFKEYTD